MYNQVWNACHPSVCHLGFFNERGICVESLSGFKVGNTLVTSQQIFYIERAQKVVITFVGKDANTVTATIRIPYRELVGELRIGYVTNNGYCALFNIDLPEFESIPSLKMSERLNFSIGAPVALLAYNNGHSNLSLSTGIISSQYTNCEGVKFIQFSQQTIYGNCGAPLIDPDSFEVIGIVTCSTTPAAKAYRQLLETINTNIDELNKVGNYLSVGGIDMAQVLIANQNQLKHLATNLYKNSASNISQAVTLHRIISYFSDTHYQQKDIEILKEEERAYS